MNLLTLTPEEFCEATRACDEWRELALTHATMDDVWDACPRADWLIWICRKAGRMPDARTLRLFAVWCARHTPLGDGRVTGHLLTDPRALVALEVAERHAHGRATDAELSAARADAYAASANSANGYLAAAAATTAAVAAVDNAAYAAAYVAYVAHVAADAAARQAQADQYRRMVDNPFRAKEDKL